MIRSTINGVVVTVCMFQQLVVANDDRIVIAHRGASGYAPEHTLEAVAMAHGMGADLIEQDIVLTSDGVPIVLHDIYLDTVTNVAELFPHRKRDDGRYYVIDFKLQEIQTLNVTERIDIDSREPVFPKRFPTNKSSFEISTMAESIELIMGLNKSTGRNVGIYTEIKLPAWHGKQGVDVSKAVLAVLKEYGYEKKTDNAMVQCFDSNALKRIRNELNCELRLVQLIGENDWEEADNVDFDKMRTANGLKVVAQYADGIGPRIQQIIVDSDERDFEISDLVALAHENKLTVHAYTVRSDALPENVKTFEELIEILFHEAKVDGVFTDFPDKVIKELELIDLLMSK